MSKPLPSPFPDMDDAGQAEHNAKPGSGVPGFVFLSQPQGDSMRPSNRHYKPPSFHAANRGHHQFPPHSARFGNGNNYRGADGNRGTYHNSRGRGRGNNSYVGNDYSYGNAQHGNSNRGNSYFAGNNSPNGNKSSYGNNSFHSPLGNKSPSSYNAPRGNSLPFGYSSPVASNLQTGPNSSPGHPPSFGGNSPFGSPAASNSSFQSSPFSGAGGRGQRGRGGRGQNTGFSGRGRGGRGGRNTPLSDVPAEKFMSDGMLQNPWERLINSLEPKQKQVFLAEEEQEEVIGIDASSDPSSRKPNAGDDSIRTSSSTVPSSSIEESNDVFADSWQ